jgi:hypothetical protein
MLTVTESAWKRLSQLQSTRPGVTTMRLTHTDGLVKCHRGVQKKRDLIIDHPGRPTLVMTATVAEDLNSRTLDARETDRGPRLRLKQISP